MYGFMFQSNHLTSERSSQLSSVASHYHIANAVHGTIDLTALELWNCCGTAAGREHAGPRAAGRGRAGSIWYGEAERSAEEAVAAF